MSRLVLDASVTVVWALADEQDQRADRVLEALKSYRALVPSVWRFEVANALLVAERRGRTTPAEVGRFLDLLTALPITVVGDPDERVPNAASTLGRLHRLSAYDAAYLDLAIRHELPLATADAALSAAAVTCGVAAFPDGES